MSGDDWYGDDGVFADRGGTGEAEAVDDTLSVSEFAALINGVLRRHVVRPVWVRGEIRDYVERGAHVYFTICDDDPGAEASLAVKFFANVRQRVRPLLEAAGMRLANGLKVRICGEVDFYAPRGSLSLKMTGIDPRFTLGELALRREELLRRLRAEGLFDRNRSLAAPVVPLRVGVVTSRDSAAWADFSHELTRSGYGFSVVLVDVRVQGERATFDVPAAIAALAARDLDVIAVVRGGGSATDLAAFDAPEIAEAIARCRLPVFTGIGHETDRSVADEVAYRGLKTPTACAAALAELVRDFVERTEQSWRTIADLADDHLTAADEHLAGCEADTRRFVEQAVERSTRSLHQRAEVVVRRVHHALDRAAARLERAGDRAGRAPRLLDERERRLRELEIRVHLLDPATTLARGWSITRTVDGRSVRDASTLRPGDEIVTTFADGAARSRVEETT